MNKAKNKYKESVISSEFDMTYLSYIQSLKTLEPMKDEEKVQIFSDIAEATDDYCRKIFLFACSNQRLLEIIKNSINNKKMTDEVFLSSSLAKYKKSDLPQILEQWHDNLQVAFDKVKKAYQDKNKDFDLLKSNLIQVACQISLSFDYIEELYQLIVECMILGKADSEKNQKGNVANNELLAEKFLIFTNNLEEQLNLLEESRNMLIKLKHMVLESHLRLVVSVGQSFRNRGLPFSDIIQEGNIGLIRAIDKFDVSLGHKFSTYAVWWIKNSIIRGIAEKARTIRIPAHMLSTINQIIFVEQKLLQKLGREPDSDEIASEMNMPTARINAIRCMAQQPISLQTPTIKSDDKLVLEDLLSYDSCHEKVMNFDSKNTYEMLYKMLDFLTEKEREIIVFRYGLLGNKPLALNDLSKRYNLTRERIRQIEVKILHKLRNPEIIKLLDDCAQYGED